MARPRTHDDRTREALLDAAERLLARDGPAALSVRAVAAEAGTTTRAVYSVLGSKGGLLGALAGRAFAWLGDALDAVPVTDDAGADVVACGLRVYRRFVTEHPSLYRITFQRVDPELVLTDELLAARAATWAKLEMRFERLGGRRPPRAAAVEFNAMCEGLAAAELRGGTLRPDPAEVVWREAYETLVRGLTA